MHPKPRLSNCQPETTYAPEAPLIQRVPPLAGFVYCPRCAATPLARPMARAFCCPACGFEFYFNCASAVAALLLCRGKLVLGVRAKAPQQGMLDLPGGFVEFDETAEQALRREVMEEFNLEISNPAYLASAPNDYAYGGVVYKTTDLFFVCEAKDVSAIKAGDDVGGYELADPFLLDPDRLAFPSGRFALQRLKALLHKAESRGGWNGS